MGALEKMTETLELDHKELHEALARAQALAEISLDGRIVNSNTLFQNLVSQSGSEISGSNYKDLCELDVDSEFSEKQFWEKIRTGEIITREIKLKSKGSVELWVLGTFTPVLADNGDVKKVILVLSNISELKQELKVRNDIMNITSIVSEANLKGDILNCNDKFVEISKYNRDELIGKPHNTTRHPDMSKEVFKEMWATIGRGNIFRGVVKNRAKDGTPYFVDAVIAPVIGANGKPRKYIGVRYDITTQELERQYMKGIFDAINSSYAFIEFDMNGGIIHTNKNFQDTFEYTEEELKNKSDKIFCDAAFVNSHEYAAFWSDLKSGNARSGIFKRFSKTGKEVWCQAAYTPVKDEMDRVVKVVMISSNVSELILIQNTSSSLSAAAMELTATASQLSSTAGRTKQESSNAFKLANDVAMGVQTVATNIEEMVASIKEIARSTSESSSMAKTTLNKANESNTAITKLGVSSQEIGAVIKVISSIAQQTNLLALNATIEAARAGEAGKGFAVVANEVKELAKQTARATDDITNKIGAIQTDTKFAIDAIADISEAVDRLNGISTVIATAVEEQTATTNEISRVMAQSKKGVETITEAIKVVENGATESLTGTSQTLDACQGLSELAERLTSLTKKVK